MHQYAFLLIVTIHYSFKETKSLCCHIFKELFVTLWNIFLFTRKWTSFYCVRFNISFFCFFTLWNISYTIINSYFSQRHLYSRTSLIIQKQNTRFKIYSYNFCQVNYIETIRCTVTIFFLLVRPWILYSEHKQCPFRFMKNLESFLGETQAYEPK